MARLDAGNGRADPAPARRPSARCGRPAASWWPTTAAGWLPTRAYGRSWPDCRAGSLWWDPHPRGEPPLPGTRLATPNEREARRFAGPARAAADGLEMPLRQVARDAATLSRAWGMAVAVTLGEQGAALLSLGDDAPFLAPAPPAAARGSHDACGAGDCFAAAAAQALRAGGLLTEVVTEAVRAASEFVAGGGASAAPSLAVPPEPGRPSADAAPAGSAWDLVADVRPRGGRIVATGGCFDLLHARHVGLLRQARRLGDCLIVCLNSDASARALKGPGLPLVAAPDRARVLATLECVDAVIVFDEPTPTAVLDRLRPDVWVKGGGYARSELAETPVVRRYGGEVVLLPYTGHSTAGSRPRPSRRPGGRTPYPPDG